MHYWINRLSHPIRGLVYAIQHDFAFQFEITLGVITLPLLYFFFGPFSTIEILVLLFCWFFVLVTELQNSALETALDRIHPERHELIGRSKDLAAGSVLIAATFALVGLLAVLSGKL